MLGHTCGHAIKSSAVWHRHLCLWGNRASRLVNWQLFGRQDARRPHSQDGCAPARGAHIVSL